MRGLSWTKTKGGAFECGPYLLAERIDGGWNATALFEFKGEPDPENTSVTIELDCPTLDDAISAAEKFHRNVTTGLFRHGLLSHQDESVLAARMLICREFKCEYRNYRGEIAVRCISPLGVSHGSTEWHPKSGLILTGVDTERNVNRDFCVADFNPDTFEVIKE
jgi:hypothetical protein